MQEPAYILYRETSIGKTLTDALDDLISEGRLTPQLAMKILFNFDHIMARVLSQSVTGSMSIKGKLDTYRFCDDVWTFTISAANINLLERREQFTVDKIRIISCPYRNICSNETVTASSRILVDIGSSTSGYTHAYSNGYGDIYIKKS